MIDVNLLPFELRPIKHTPVPYLITVAILIVALGAMLMVWLQNNGVLGEERAILAQHQRELDGLKKIVEETENLNQQKLLLADKMAVIQEIVSDRIIWSRQLWNISRLTPKNFWYSGIAELEKTSRERQLVLNPKTQKSEYKTVPVKHRILELGGYVIQGEDASRDINPLTFNLEQDEEFSSLFQLSLPKLWDTEFEGHPVRAFTLEYLIKPGSESAE